MLALLPVPAWSQDVIKPPGGTTTIIERLPAPMPTARQLPDGRIEVRWPAVEGAVKYDIRRSVPPAAQTVISRPNPAETTYVDADVKAGSTYYYAVAAIDSAGTMGLRAGTPPVTATTTPGTTTTTTTTSTPTTATGSSTETVDITVYVTAPNPPSLRLTFPSSPYGGRLERWIFRASTTDPTQLDPLSKTITSLGDIPASGSSANDSLASATYPRWVKYQLVRQGVFAESYTHVSAPLLIPAATTTTTTTTPVTASPSATIVTAALATVAAGATISVSSAGGSGARWLSLNESVATVDQSGTVTGRAAGSTRVIAATTASDGSLKVVAIPVTVTP